MNCSFHHIALNVSNLTKSIEFYTKILGFKKGLSFESSNKVTKIQYLGLNDINLELTSRSIKLHLFKRDASRVMIKHIAFKVENIKTVYKQLVDKVDFISEIKVKVIDSGIIKYFFIKDPDRIEIEFVEINLKEDE